MLRLRLVTKIVLAVTGASLLAVCIAGLGFRLASGPAFRQLVTTEAQSHFRADVIEYYHETGRVEGIREWLANRLGERPPAAAGSTAAPLPPAPEGIVRFGLANPGGTVVLPGDGYTDGQVVGAAVISRGTKIVVDGQFIGTILPSPTEVPLSDAQRTYAGQITVALALAGLIGTAVAIFIGVGFSDGIVRPVRRLTAAAREVADGRLAQEVPVKGADELAEMGSAFNRMSMDLARYEQARRQMAADISHELRTPLTTIIGYVEAMRDGDLAPTAERLDSVHRQTQRLANVIEDLRLLSMTDVGALPLQLAPISVRELIVQSVRAYEIRASQRGIALRADVEEEVPEVNADPGRIQQVIEILVNNALRHTDQGEIVVSAAREGDGAVIRVADTGSGIEPEILPRLFDRFYRGEQARRKDGEGSGLGLAIAKAIISAHDGTIAVASQLAKGTVFTIHLPAAVAEA